MNLFLNKMSVLLAMTLCCATVVSSLAQTKKAYIINGTLKNRTIMPTKIYLNYDAIAHKKSDSAFVKEGKFTIRGEVDAAMIATLALKVSQNMEPDQDKLNLMLDKGVLDVVSDGALSNSLVTGSGATANNQYREITSFTLHESAELKKIMESAGYSTNEALKETVRTRSANLLGNSLTNIIRYVRKNPNAEISPYFTYGLIASGYLTPQMMDTLNRGFPVELRASTIGVAIDNVLAKRAGAEVEAAAKRKALDNLVPIGSKAIDFIQNDVNGKPVSLASFKGKYVLIDFWASWCMPCRKENPNVVKAYNVYKEKGFTVLGVSLDGAAQKDKWIEAIKKDGLTWTQVSDLKGGNNAAALLYHVETIPQNFLVDPNGVIVAKNLRGEELEVKLKEIFTR